MSTSRNELSYSNEGFAYSTYTQASYCIIQIYTKCTIILIQIYRFHFWVVAPFFFQHDLPNCLGWKRLDKSFWSCLYATTVWWHTRPASPPYPVMIWQRSNFRQRRKGLVHLTVHKRLKNILRQLNVMKYTPIHQCNCFINTTSWRPVSNFGFTRDPFKPTNHVVLFTVTMKALRHNKQLRRRRNCFDQRQPCSIIVNPEYGTPASKMLRDMPTRHHRCKHLSLTNDLLADTFQPMINQHLRNNPIEDHIVVREYVNHNRSPSGNRSFPRRISENKQWWFWQRQINKPRFDFAKLITNPITKLLILVFLSRVMSRRHCRTQSRSHPQCSPQCVSNCILEQSSNNLHIMTPRWKMSFGMLHPTFHPFQLPGFVWNKNLTQSDFRFCLSCLPLSRYHRKNGKGQARCQALWKKHQEGWLSCHPSQTSSQGPTRETPWNVKSFSPALRTPRWDHRRSIASPVHNMPQTFCNPVESIDTHSCSKCQSVENEVCRGLQLGVVGLATLRWITAIPLTWMRTLWLQSIGRLGGTHLPHQQSQSVEGTMATRQGSTQEVANKHQWWPWFQSGDLGIRVAGLEPSINLDIVFSQKCFFQKTQDPKLFSNGTGPHMFLPKDSQQWSAERCRQRIH